MLAFLLIVTATFTPAKPTVGDLVTVEFGASARLDPSPHYEIVSQTGSRVVIRVFQPKPVALSGVAGERRFEKLILPVETVLKPFDDLKPAPLKPPREVPQTRVPIIAIASAAAMAIALWSTAILLARRRRAAPEMPSISPADRFRQQVDALRQRRPATPWASLADALRVYLASRGFGSELTTRQLLERIGGLEPNVRQVIADTLRLGDLEKFSPWGAAGEDFDSLAAKASVLPDVLEPPPVAEEQEAA
ncbi:MAG TPA: hypothetical protein VFL80_08075 [Thermoanaerobaculia bacterium]|nr:hypothetical protein [Thermoanaerobaculia bacterium]